MFSVYFFTTKKLYFCFTTPGAHVLICSHGKAAYTQEDSKDNYLKQVTFYELNRRVNHIICVIVCYDVHSVANCEVLTFCRFPKYFHNYYF